jgi:hypothetical protein
MSRNPQLEAVFAARYAWENAVGPARSECLGEYHRLLDEAMAKAGFKGLRREELEDSLTDAYREFRRAKRLEERAKLSRLR